MFENVGQGRAFDWTMGGDSELQNFIPSSLLKADVASSLSDDLPTVPLEGSHDVNVRKAGDLGQSSISATCALSS